MAEAAMWTDLFRYLAVCTWIGNWRLARRQADAFPRELEFAELLVDLRRGRDEAHPIDRVSGEGVPELSDAGDTEQNQRELPGVIVQQIAISTRALQPVAKTDLQQGRNCGQGNEGKNDEVKRLRQPLLYLVVVEIPIERAVREAYAMVPYVLEVFGVLLFVAPVEVRKRQRSAENSVRFSRRASTSASERGWLGEGGSSD